jgi:hypothetical protein
MPRPSPRLRSACAAALLLACDAPDDGTLDTADPTVPGEPSTYLDAAPADFVPHALVPVGDGWRVAGESLGDVAVVALDADLRVDATWADAGAFVADLGGPDGLIPQNVDAAYALAADADGLWVGGAGQGAFTAAEGQFALLRLDAAGALDPSFGAGGIRLTDWGQPSAVEHLTPTDAGLIAWGQVRNPDDLDLAAVRYDAAGGVDATYADGGGGAGVLEPQPGPDDASAVVRDGDGHLVGGGGFAVRRVTGSGMFDTSFGDGGTLDLGDGRLDQGLPTPEGGAWFAGPGAVGDVDGLRVAKLLPDHTLDPSFGTGGIAEIAIPIDIVDFGDTSVPTTVVRVRGLARAEDGRLVAYVQLLGLTSQVPALVVLRADGTPDTAIGTGGVLLLDGAFGILEGALPAHDALLAVAGDRAVIVDRWLEDAPGGGVVAYPVALPIPLTP